MSVEPLVPSRHAALRVRPLENYSFLEKVHYLPLLATEFTHANIEFPIVFLKGDDTGLFQPVAMLGLARGTNAFVKDGRWTGLYLPAIARQAPFRLMSTADQPDRVYLGIDTAHETVSETDGEPLFDSDSNYTPFLEQRKKALFDYAEHTQLTRAFIDLVQKHDLLRETTLTFGPEGQAAGIRGIYVIDENRLNELPGETFIELRDRGFLGLAYAHLASLQQVRRLGGTAPARPAVTPNDG